MGPATHPDGRTFGADVVHGIHDAITVPNKPTKGAVLPILAAWLNRFPCVFVQYGSAYAGFVPIIPVRAAEFETGCCFWIIHFCQPGKTASGYPGFGAAGFFGG